MSQGWYGEDVERSSTHALVGERQSMAVRHQQRFGEVEVRLPGALEVVREVLVHDEIRLRVRRLSRFDLDDEAGGQRLGSVLGWLPVADRDLARHGRKTSAPSVRTRRSYASAAEKALIGRGNYRRAERACARAESERS